MPLSAEEQQLRDRYFQELLDAARRLQAGPDPEVALEALIEAAGLLKDRLERELEEIRLEQAE